MTLFLTQTTVGQPGRFRKKQFVLPLPMVGQQPARSEGLLTVRVTCRGLARIYMKTVMATICRMGAPLTVRLAIAQAFGFITTSIALLPQPHKGGISAVCIMKPSSVWCLMLIQSVTVTLFLLTGLPTLLVVV